VGLGPVERVRPGLQHALVKQADLPASYADLLDPRWKGKLGIEASDEDWFAEWCGTSGRKRPQAVSRAGAKNGLSVRRGHSLLAQMVPRAKWPFALTVYNFTRAAQGQARRSSGSCFHRQSRTATGSR